VRYLEIIKDYRGRGLIEKRVSAIEALMITISERLRMLLLLIISYL